MVDDDGPADCSPAGTPASGSTACGCELGSAGSGPPSSIGAAATPAAAGLAPGSAVAVTAAARTTTARTTPAIRARRTKRFTLRLALAIRPLTSGLIGRGPPRLSAGFSPPTRGMGRNEALGRAPFPPCTPTRSTVRHAPASTQSADYVKPQARRRPATRSPSQAFEFPFFQETCARRLRAASRPSRGRTTDDEFATIELLGQRRRDRASCRPSTSSCRSATTRRARRPAAARPADFAGFTAGNSRADAARHLRLRRQGAERRGRRRDRRRSSSTRASPAARTLLAGTLGGPASTIPVVGTSYAARRGARPADPRPADVTVHIVTEHVSETRTTKNVIADTKAAATRPDASSSARTSTRCPRARASTTTARGTATDLEIGDPDRQARPQAAPARALRVLGRRGGGPAGLDALRREPRSRRSSEIYAEPQLRHARLAELRALRLRRRRLGHRHGRTARLGADRGAVQRVLRRPGARDGADRVRRALGLRAVHRRRHPRRRPVQRRRGREDRRAGRHLRRHRRRGRTTPATTRRATRSNNLNTKALNELGDGVVHATWTLAKSKSGLFEDQSLRARTAIKGQTDGPLAVH